MQGMLFKPWKIEYIRNNPGIELQTRRVIKPQPRKVKNLWEWGDEELPLCLGVDEKQLAECIAHHPQYQVGETVYIKEAWRTDAVYDKTPPSDIGRDALIEFKGLPDEVLSVIMGRWRSPLHLPAEHARLFIRILDVKPEPLQKITFNDCLAEGIIMTEFWRQCIYEPAKLKRDYSADCPGQIPSSDGIDEGWNEYTHQVFRNLWNSINAARGYPWESNSWVWAITFKYLFNGVRI